MESIILDFVRASFPIFLCYICGPALSFSVIQSIKMARRECSKPKLPRFLIRILAGLYAGVFTFAPLVVFLDMTFEKAALHAVIVCVGFPYVMAGIMSVAESKYPLIYKRLKIHRRRPEDNRDPDDTIEGFF